MTNDLGNLVSEARLPESMRIDQAEPLEILRIINEQDRLVTDAVARCIPEIAAAVERITGRMRAGGRLIYVGAGTSGRLGVLDASEIPPTFGAPPELVQGIIAGGIAAVSATREGLEDSEDEGVRDIAARVLPGDSVLGIAASGRTPYTVAAVREARRIGCLTVALSNNPDSPLAREAEITIAPVVGPEVIMGSTRLKAGTSQKLVLNMISTAVMIRLGKVYTNLMVDMQPSNAKLRQRAVRMVVLATEAGEATAQQALEQCGYHAKTAVVMILTGLDAANAAAALSRSDGFVRRAIEQVTR